jgi:hypothetical protein
MAERDLFEAAILRGAALALRRRAERQAQLAADGMTIGERGVVFRTGEGALANRLSFAFASLADEIEREGGQ